MAQALERLLGKRVTGGWINVPDGTKAKLKRIQLHESGHPVPDERGVEGARRIAEIARESGPRDLLLCVISGGASALMPLPVAGMTLEGKKAITRQLLACGATIHEMNTVRKHLSAIKGGHLAALGAPATVVALILSDVIGDDLSVIGSGPTVLDSTTVDDAAAVLKRFGIACPAADRDAEDSSKRAECDRRQQPPIDRRGREESQGARLPADYSFHHYRRRNPRDRAHARGAGARDDGPRRNAAPAFFPAAKPPSPSAARDSADAIRNSCWRPRSRWSPLRRSPSSAAAPMASTVPPTPPEPSPTLPPCAAPPCCASIPAQFLADNDSYHFFEKAGGLVKTGPTGTNVADVRILLV